MTEVEKQPTAPEAKPEQHSESTTDSDSDEDIPDLEDASTANSTAVSAGAVTGLPGDMVSKAKQSRGEKKARKIMSKLGLKPVSILILY